MARILKADHARRVTLEGVGPVPRPVDIDETQTGFTALRTLRIYSFAPSGVINGHAEEDEVFIVILTGRVQLQIRSEHWSQSEQRFTLSSPDTDNPVACAAYLPPHAEYALSPLGAADVAYARALPASARAPAVFTTAPQADPSGRVLLLEEASHAERLRLRLLRIKASNRAADLVEGILPVSSAEALVHVRTTPDKAATANADGLAASALDSWDTLAVSPHERPRILISARSSALGLVVAAE